MSLQIRLIHWYLGISLFLNLQEESDDHSFPFEEFVTDLYTRVDFDLSWQIVYP